VAHPAEAQQFAEMRGAGMGQARGRGGRIIGSERDLASRLVGIAQEEEGGVADGADVLAAGHAGDVLAEGGALVAVGAGEAQLHELVRVEQPAQLGQYGGGEAEKELAMFGNQLNNPKFVERAPAALVEDIRAKYAKSQDKLANIEQSIQALG
jgi:hypothetical protein